MTPPAQHHDRRQQQTLLRRKRRCHAHRAAPYDFFFLDEHRLCLAVGDVSGKGVPASLFMAVTRTLFRATVGQDGTPGEILTRLNMELCRDNESCMFVTLFCGILDIRTGVP